MHPKAIPQAAHSADTADHSRSAICTAAALYLMSHYAQRPCPLVAHAVADQLALLTRDCGQGASRALHALALTLLPRWQNIAGGCASGTRH